MCDSNDDAGQVDPAFEHACARDAEYRAYIYGRRRTRRRMAIIAFIWFLVFGTCIIIAALSSSDIAARVAQAGMILSTFFGSLALWIGAYWGIGAYEHQFGAGGGMGGNGGSYSGYGSGVPGFGGNGGFSGPPGGGGLPRPRLVRSGDGGGSPVVGKADPDQRGADEGQGHRSPDGQD